MDHIEVEINCTGHNCANYNYYEDDNDEVSDSDCESCVTDLNEDDQEQDSRREGLTFVDNLIRLDEKHVVYDVIAQKFLSNFGNLAENVKIVAIQKKNWSNLPQDRSMLQYFMTLSQASPKEHMKYGWLGGSKQQISKIMTHGFGCRNKFGDDDPRRRVNVCLSSVHSLVQSVQDCVLDEEGLRHVVLCRVIVRDRTKLAEGDSGMYGNGIDDGVISNKDVTQGNEMSTHILPEYVVSFEGPSYLEGISKKEQSMKKPSSPWLSFPNLISVLAKSLPQRDISLIQKHYKQFIQERMITRRDFIKKMRELVGDELLMATIKSNEMKIMKEKSCMY